MFFERIKVRLIAKRTKASSPCVQNELFFEEAISISVKYMTEKGVFNCKIVDEADNELFLAERTVLGDPIYRFAKKKTV